MLNKILVLVAAMVFPFNVTLACQARFIPTEQQATDFELIFIGEVIGVRLTEYGSALLDVAHDSERIAVWDHTPEYELTVFPLVKIKGGVSGARVFKVGGCQVPEGNVREQVLIYFDSKHERAVPIFSNEAGLYFEKLVEFGVKEWPENSLYR